eukprot:GHVS01024987.1.p1 GENE.GHVS01024987.1~~GHVS01024987.1.p1  ORF type:complete len:243 (-),score=59.36 GHVS01024987.1:115-843(-)
MEDEDVMDISPSPPRAEVREESTTGAQIGDVTILAGGGGWGLPAWAVTASTTSAEFNGLSHTPTMYDPNHEDPTVTSSHVLPTAVTREEPFPREDTVYRSANLPREQQAEANSEEHQLKQLDASFSPATSSSSSPSPPPSRRSRSPPGRRERRASPDYSSSQHNTTEGPFSRARRKTPSPDTTTSQEPEVAASVKAVSVGAMFEALEKQRVIVRLEGQGKDDNDQALLLPEGLAGTSVNDSR